MNLNILLSADNLMWLSRCRSSYVHFRNVSRTFSQDVRLQAAIHRIRGCALVGLGIEISDDTISPRGDRYRRDSSGKTFPEFSPNVSSSIHEYLSAWTLLGFD